MYRGFFIVDVSHFHLTEFYFINLRIKLTLMERERKRCRNASNEIHRVGSLFRVSN